MIKFKLITPEKLILKGEAESIICPGVGGELGFLPSHAPLLTRIGKGKLRIKQAKQALSPHTTKDSVKKTPYDSHENVERVFEVEGGFCEVLPDKITILVDKIINQDKK